MNKDLFLAENQAHQTTPSIKSLNNDECSITSDLSVKHSPEWTIQMIAQQEEEADGGVKNLTKMTLNRDEKAPPPPNESPAGTPRRTSKLDISKWADSGLPSGFTYTQNHKSKVVSSEKTSPQTSVMTPKSPPKPVLVAQVATSPTAPKSEITPRSSRPRLSSASDIDMTPTLAERERVSMGIADDVYKESADRPQAFLPLLPSPRKVTPKKEIKASVRAYNRPDEWLSPDQYRENPQTKYKFKRVVDSSELQNNQDEEDSEEEEEEELLAGEIEELTLLPATPNLNSSSASLYSVEEEHEDEDTDVQEQQEEEISSPSKDPVVEIIVAALVVKEDQAAAAPAKPLTPLERLRQAQSTSRQAVAKGCKVQKDHTLEILLDKTITGPAPKKESSRSDFYGSMSAIPFLKPATNLSSPKPASSSPTTTPKLKRKKSKRKSNSKGSGDKDKKEGEASVVAGEEDISTMEDKSQTGSEVTTEPDRTSHIMNEMAATVTSISDKDNNASSNTSIVSSSERSFLYDDEEMEAKKAMWKSMSAMDNEATDRPIEFLPLQPSKRKEKKVSATAQSAKSRAYNRPDEWLSPNQKVKIKQGWKAKKTVDPNQQLNNPEELPETSSGDDPVLDVPDHKEGVEPAPVLD